MTMSHASERLRQHMFMTMQVRGNAIIRLAASFRTQGSDVRDAGDDADGDQKADDDVDDDENDCDGSMNITTMARIILPSAWNCN